MGVFRRLGQAVVGGCAVVTFVDNIGHPATVVGSSMYPTLHGACPSERDFVWISRINSFNPQLGSIVTFISPRNPREVLIKRVTGLEHNMVRRKPTGEPFIVPEGQCWLESDNEINANDSNQFGPVSYGLLQGRATHVIWPPSRWSSL